MQQSVLITGAGRRIGRELALRMSQDGWAVAVHYGTSEAGAAEVVSMIQGEGGTACSLQGDLRDPETPARLIADAIDVLGALTCLINNASTFEYDDAKSMTPESWSQHMDVNLRAPVFLTQSFATALPEGCAANVINILDERVWKLAPTHFSYTISKAALWTATRTLAQSYAPHVRVNAVGPGPTLPNARQSQQDFETENRTMLLQRGTNPGEIADAVKFILAAPAMTGQMIALDGGQHLLWQTPDML